MTQKSALKLKHLRDSIGVITQNSRLNENEREHILQILRELHEVLDAEGYSINDLRTETEYENDWRAFI